MSFLKNNFFILLLFAYGCTSIHANYKQTISPSGGVEVTAPPDRLSPYCEKVIKDDNTISYGFMILFLDEEQTIGTATGMLSTKEACFEWQAKVKKVLDHGQSISLRGFGIHMDAPKIAEDFTYTSDNYGTYHGNGRSMDFFSIRNNNGECFATNTDSVYRQAVRNSLYVPSLMANQALYKISQKTTLSHLLLSRNPFVLDELDKRPGY